MATYASVEDHLLVALGVTLVSLLGRLSRSDLNSQR